MKTLPRQSQGQKNTMNESEISKIMTLLHDFAKLPPVDTEPTMLEICRYPSSRFEEVCSRILKFFFNPKAEHGLRDLWITALLEAIGKPELHDYRQDVTVKSEEWADGKRIDLTIVADKYVIAIENKITADVYNPLDVYKDYIEKTYKNKKIVLLVLSMKPILNLHNIMKNDYKWCSYNDLFGAVKRLLGEYVMKANQKYLIFMFDFIKTISNMNTTNSNLEQKFFSENRAEIEKLIERFNKYKEELYRKQVEQTAILKEMTIKETGDGAWWIYDGTDLGYTFNANKNPIGIESWFIEENGNPCAKFYVCITTWKTADWQPYKDAVLNRFADFNPQEEYRGNRVYLHLTNNIPGDNAQGIIAKLRDVYTRMKEIATESSDAPHQCATTK